MRRRHMSQTSAKACALQGAIVGLLTGTVLGLLNDARLQRIAESAIIFAVTGVAVYVSLYWWRESRSQRRRR